MIDLKAVISKYPDSILNGKRLKSILLDLYPDEKLYGSLLSQILDDGIADEIKNKEKIDVIEFINLCNRLEKKHGIAQKYIEGCLTIWANAFDVPIKTRVEPIKRGEPKFTPRESTIHTHKYVDSIVPPTCTEKGYTLHSCNCGYEYKDNFVNPKHDYVLIEYTDPTCETDGKELYKCIHCGNEKTEIVKAKGHKFGRWVEQEKPLCEKDGYEVRQCSVCGKIETNSISRTGHKFTAWRKEGDDYVRDCSACGFTEKKGLPIESVGQIFEFGRYPQTRDGGILPIKWKVLEIKNKKAFLLSECGLDKKPYDSRICNISPFSQRETVKWSNSYIRTWLNTDFLNEAFLDSEKKSIIRTNNTNVVYTLKEYIYMQSGGLSRNEMNISKTISDSTTDLVFLPSMHDIEQLYSFRYNGNLKEKIGKIKCGLDANCIWVIRDLEYYSRINKTYGRERISYSPLAVSENTIWFGEHIDEYSIRPAMWVDLSTTEEKEQKLKEEQERRKLEEERKAAQAQLKQERALKAAEEKRKEEILKKERRDKGVCQHCGGEFKGWLIKKCSTCGKRKDY